MIIPPCTTVLWIIWKWLVIYASVFFFLPFPFLPAPFRCKSCQSHCLCKQQPNTYSSEWFLSQPAGGVLRQRREQLRLVLVTVMSDVNWTTHAGTVSTNTFRDCWFLDWLPVVPAGNVIVYDNIWEKIYHSDCCVYIFSCLLIDWN